MEEEEGGSGWGGGRGREWVGRRKREGVEGRRKREGVEGRRKRGRVDGRRKWGESRWEGDRGREWEGVGGSEKREGARVGSFHFNTANHNYFTILIVFPL